MTGLRLNVWTLRQSMANSSIPLGDFNGVTLLKCRSETSELCGKIVVELVAVSTEGHSI
jgi:hypothetical protein